MPRPDTAAASGSNSDSCPTTRNPLTSRAPTPLDQSLYFVVTLGLFAPASAQVPPGDADYSAYSTGTVVHAEGLEQPELQDPTSVRVVDSEVAFSGAVVESTGLNQDRFNEYGALVMPAQDAKNSYGRGYGDGCRAG